MELQRVNDTLNISGLKQLTAANADSFQSAVKNQLTPDIKNLVLHADDIDLMDSTGLGVMIIIHKTISQHEGVTTISNPTNIVLQLLKMTRLNQVFKIVTT